MKRIVSIFILISLLMVSSCVRKPSSYSQNSSSRGDRISTMEDKEVHPGSSSSRRTKSTRASRAIHSATHDASLPEKVQRLAAQIERKFKADSYSASDLERWANLYVEYSIEYYLSTQNLTDEQCESIEFNLGKIAGSVYSDGIVPVIEELERVEEGLEDYEERSQKWAGAAERGFNSVVRNGD